MTPKMEPLPKRGSIALLVDTTPAESFGQLGYKSPANSSRWSSRTCFTLDFASWVYYYSTWYMTIGLFYGFLLKTRSTELFEWSIARQMRKCRFFVQPTIRNLSDRALPATTSYSYVLCPTGRLAWLSEGVP